MAASPCVSAPGPQPRVQSSLDYQGAVNALRVKASITTTCGSHKRRASRDHEEETQMLRRKDSKDVDIPKEVERGRDVRRDRREAGAQGTQSRLAAGASGRLRK